MNDIKMSNNLFANIQSKERSTNFTKAETDRLQSLVAKYKNIIFCKKTDGVSSKQKDSVWHIIQCEFNALGDTSRSVKQLKYKFDNLKRTAKKGASQERQEMRRTGGGPPPLPPPSSDDATEWLRSIIPSSVDGNEAIYDDDTLSQTTVFPAKKLDDKLTLEIDQECVTEESEISMVPENEVTLIEVNEASNKKEFDASTPYSSLRRPISSPLRRRAKKGRLEENGNLVRQLLREKKIAIMDNLQERELKKINDSIRHAQEVHDQLLRHNEERHQLLMKKLQIEIEILKKNKEQ